jgi:hypothetical protein
MIDKKTISIDSEYHTKNGRIEYVVCVCTKDSEEEQPRRWWLIDDRDTRSFKEYVESHKKDRVFICHALEKAEGQMFYHLGLNPAEYRWYCTMTVERIIQKGNNILHSELDKVAKSILGDGLALVDLEKKYGLYVAGREDKKESYHQLMILGVKETIQRHEKGVLDYCCDDIDHLLEIANKQIRYFESIILYHSARIYSVRTLEQIPRMPYSWFDCLVRICGASAIYAKCAYKGQYVDDRARRLYDRGDDLIRSMKEQFNQDMKPVYREDGSKSETALFELIRSTESDFQSLNPDFRWPRSETGKYSIDEKTFDREDFKHIPWVARYREIKKMETAIKAVKGDKFQNMRGNGPVYSNPCHHMPGTQTGRAAGKPKEGFVPLINHTMRSLMNPRDEEHVLVSIDFKAQETATMAAWSGDEVMKWCYGDSDKDDFYVRFGTRAGIMPEGATKKTHPELREDAKITCLEKSYGAGAATIALGLHKPLEEGKRLSKLYDDTFKTFTDKMRKLKKIVSDNKIEVFIFLLPDFLPYVWWNSECPKCKYPTKRLTSLTNLPIQGSGSSILRGIIKRLDDEGFDIVCTIHDEVVLNIPKSRLDLDVEHCKKVFVEEFQKVFPGNKVRVGEPEFREYNGRIISHEAMDNDQWRRLFKFGIFSEDEVDLA